MKNAGMSLDDSKKSRRKYSLREIRTVQVTAKVWAHNKIEAIQLFQNGNASNYDDTILDSKDLVVTIDETAGIITDE